MPEDADEARRILLEHGFGLRGKLLPANDKAVHSLGPAKAGYLEGLPDRYLGPGRLPANGKGEPALNVLRRLVDGLGRPVIILHEALDAVEQRGLGVPQAQGHTRLGVQVQGVGWTHTLKMQLVADAQQEVVGLAEVVDFGRGEVPLAGQLLHMRYS